MIKISWRVPDKVLLADLSETITADDLSTGEIEITRCLLDAHSERVHVVYDIAKASTIAFSANQLRTTLTYFRHPKLGWLVVVGATGAMKVLTQVFASLVDKMTPILLHYSPTMNEALAFLRERDDTMPGSADSLSTGQ
jgi:hypothetical protein